MNCPECNQKGNEYVGVEPAELDHTLIGSEMFDGVVVHVFYCMACNHVHGVERRIDD